MILLLLLAALVAFSIDAQADELRIVAAKVAKTHDARLAPELSAAQQCNGEFLGLTRDNQMVVRTADARVAGAAEINAAADLRKVSLLVGYKGKKPAGKSLKAAGCRQLADQESCKFLKLDFGESLTPAEIQSLLNDPAVRYVEPDYILSIPDVEAAKPAAQVKAQEGANQTPNDPGYSQLWGMANINAPNAWDSITNAPNVVVAVIDTGVDYTHPDLAGNMWRSATGKFGHDFYSNDDDPKDEHFHGTHCAGTIAAVGNNEAGVAGVCWQTKIMALRFLGPDGGGSTSAAVNCINYARANGAHILSNSWGGGSYSQALNDAISLAAAQGILFIAAAGNSNVSSDVSAHYPSSYDHPNVVAVGAIDINDNKSSFSNYGAMSVDLGAPGSGIYSTFPTYLTAVMQSRGYPLNYHTISGTSMATPHVAGAMALCWAKKYSSPLPLVSQMNDVRDSLLQNARAVPALAGFWGHAAPATIPGGVLDIAFLGSSGGGGGGITGKTYETDITWYQFSPFATGKVMTSITFNTGGGSNFTGLTWSQTGTPPVINVQTTVTDFFTGGPVEIISCNGFAYGNTLFLFGYNPAAGLLIWNGTSSTPLGTADSTQTATNSSEKLDQLTD